MRELTHAILHKALGQAAKWGMVARNVCDAVEKPKAPKKTMQVLDLDGVFRFLEAAEADRLYALYVLAITTGLREGELFGLQIDDLALKGGALCVRHNLEEVSGRLWLGEPKTAAGQRRIELPAFVVAILRQHRKRMLAEGHPGPFVFCDTAGGPLRKSNFLRRSFKPLLAAAGLLPQLRFQDLRHTAATLLCSQGVHPKVVQERLGHAQISLTLDTYSHVLPSMQKEAARKLDDLFRRSAAQRQGQRHSK
jgi:integrase